MNENGNITEKIGFGGGCHWCTEAYFQSLVGVIQTEQGWISSLPPYDIFSEAVIVHYDPAVISLDTLIAIHLHTHACTKNHSMRKKYRSAVYFFDDIKDLIENIITQKQSDFKETILTQALPFKDFRLNSADQLNYFQRNRGGEFCERYIHPKLRMLHKQYAHHFKEI